MRLIYSFRVTKSRLPSALRARDFCSCPGFGPWPCLSHSLGSGPGLLPHPQSDSLTTTPSEPFLTPALACIKTRACFLSVSRLLCATRPGRFFGSGQLRFSSLRQPLFLIRRFLFYTARIVLFRRSTHVEPRRCLTPLTLLSSIQLIRRVLCLSLGALGTQYHFPCGIVLSYSQKSIRA